jgi:hypothetical protein
MPPPQSEFDREMHALEAEMKRLEAEYNMFFAGRLPRLPWERKKRVETLVRNYDRADSRSTADRFRFQTLQSRFVKFLELWDRQLRDREESGRSKPKRNRAAAVPAAPAAAESTPAESPAPAESTADAPGESPVPSIPEPAPAAASSPATPSEPARAKRKPHAPSRSPEPPLPAERELHVMKLHAKTAESDRVKELYDRLAEAKRQVGETPLPFDRVAALVNAQLQKHGSSADDVAFRIAVKDGKVSLTVKPVKD